MIRAQLDVIRARKSEGLLEKVYAATGSEAARYHSVWIRNPPFTKSEVEVASRKQPPLKPSSVNELIHYNEVVSTFRDFVPVPNAIRTGVYVLPVATSSGSTGSKYLS